jgi:hypothetical protein
MAKINVDRNTFLNLYNLKEFNGIIFWEKGDFPEIPLSNNDEYVQVKDYQAKRLDLIADDKYGDPNLMWVIMIANDIQYPNQLYSGRVIRLPAQSTIDQLLTETQ